MADYTDGQGWSKLDATSARHLAQVISMFHGRAASKRTEMLLYCFSQLQGNCPYFRTGFRTIAKACDTKPDVARRFLVFCDTEEIFKAVGKTQKGKTPKRTFFWLDPNDDSYCGGQTPHPVAKHKEKTPHYCGETSYSNATHQIQSIREGESSKSDLSPRASSVYANAPTDARQKEQPMTGVEFAIAEEEILQRLDKAPHNSPEQKKCSAELTELRNLRDRQKHGGV